MERTLSVEEKIRRAEEIYERRQGENQRKTATVNINDNNKKDIKLLKKMLIQIAISLCIYFAFYIIQNSSYIFSEDFINQAKKILSYDMNFTEIYTNLKEKTEQGIEFFKKRNLGIGGAEEENIQSNQDEEKEKSSNQENSQSEETDKQDSKENGEKDSNENNQDEENNSDNVNHQNQDNENNESQNINSANNQENPGESSGLTQEEQDIKKIKETTTFIKPVEGIISSKYGQRSPTTSTVPKNHTGTDIAANTGTKIISATDGEVVLSSEEGDYGKHLKIQIGEVSIIYAHCSKLYVKQGDKVTQGQEIAEVGSTGNSTGPHLHFEIRISERTIDPEKILQL